ncbi:phosphotransferase [Dactylosporangium vinaceum]|uniref:Phosphotransferase n=1 Tax=Dactylosporangium vinaceum TaxID=53362 RepID=A0ABV5M9V3_9ACTN|nr:phosphotransferase [Dactylosporangium vinaceum]UAB93163.1 phosphotransferase [Dactylosporangium vinaceum]
MPWGRPAGLRELLEWAGHHVTVTGPPVQHKTWNLAALFRLPTTDGPVWLKAIPPFAAAEPAALAAYATADPALVPSVIAAARGRILLSDIPGRDGWSATDTDVTAAVTRLVEAQARLTTPLTGGPDRRPAVHPAVGPPRRLRPAHTLVRGDFHPGNWRVTAARPVLFDFADAHLGHPALDGCRAAGFLPPARRPAAAAAWIAAWTRACPASRPAAALRIAEPLSHLSYALRYQEFLDNIEPTERRYHHGARPPLSATPWPPPGPTPPGRSAATRPARSASGPALVRAGAAGGGQGGCRSSGPGCGVTRPAGRLRRPGRGPG